MDVGPMDTFVLEEVRKCLAQIEGTQHELAHRFGLTQKQVSRLRTGDWKNPPASVLDAVAKAASTSLIEILARFERVGPPPPMSPTLRELADLYRQILTRDRRTALLELARGYVRMEQAAGRAPLPRMPRGRPS